MKPKKALFRGPERFPNQKLHLPKGFCWPELVYSKSWSRYCQTEINWCLLKDKRNRKCLFGKPGLPRNRRFALHGECEEVIPVGCKNKWKLSLGKPLLRVPWHQKNLFFNMIIICVYSAENIIFYTYSKYILGFILPCKSECQTVVQNSIQVFKLNFCFLSKVFTNI